MNYAINQFKLWRCLQGNFLYRIHQKLNVAIKILMSVVIGALVLLTLTRRIQEMFNYAG